jgi:hypothetical protein
MDCKVVVKDTQIQLLGKRLNHCQYKHPTTSPNHKNIGIGVIPILSMTKPENMCGVCSQSFYIQHMEPMHISIKQKYTTYLILLPTKEI